MNNRNIESIKKLVSPYELKNDINLKYEDRIFIEKSREEINDIVNGKNNKKLVIVGPCSVHNYEQCLEYAKCLKEMSKEMTNLYIVMRMYVEKPRTIGGWKGFLYDPDLNESNDISKGLVMTRKLLLEITKLKLPIATEFLDTIIPQYIDDLICWGCIGARTVESQLHRQLASGLSICIGFKNRTDGNVDVAINGMLSAKNKHSFLGVDINGSASIVNTNGNNNTGIVLRGGSCGKNLDSDSIKKVISKLEKANCNKSVILDVSHDNSFVNSKKDYKEQINNIEYICNELILNNRINEIKGVMIESNIKEGKQIISDNLKYGVSITDGCISLEDTYECLKKMDNIIN